MPQNQIHIREEMKILGAIQIMNGLITQFLGTIWGYLLISQTTALLSVYVPIVTVLGYLVWSSLSFIFSGALTVFAQRRPTMYTMSYAIVVNIISSCIAGLGLLLLTVELSVAIFLTETSMWQMRSAKMLSEYVFLFTALELFVTCVAIQWAYKAKKSNLNT